MKTIIKVIVIIVLLLLAFDQSRTIYKIDDSHYITVWKRLRGKCIITFDKYYSIFKPSRYIETTTSNYLTIVINKESSKSNFGVLSGYDLPVRFVGYKNVDFYQPDQNDDFKKRYYINGDHLEHYLYFSIDIKEQYMSK